MSAAEGFVAFAVFFFAARAGISLMRESAAGFFINAAFFAWGIAAMGKG